MSSIAASELVINPDGSVYHLGLRPDQLCDTVLLVGDPGRVAAVSKYFDKVRAEVVKREFTTHIGELNGKPLMVMSTGMGMSNVEIALLELDALANIDFDTRQIKQNVKSLDLIRIGTSGGLQPNVPVGSMLVSTQAVGFDNILDYYILEQTPFESGFCRSLQHTTGVPSMPYLVGASEALAKKFKSAMIPGITATTPGFYAPQGRMLRLPVRIESLVDKISGFEYENVRISNFEMETSGLYAFGAMLGHRVVSTNAILANRPRGEFATDTKKPVDALIRKVLELL